MKIQTPLVLKGTSKSQNPVGLDLAKDRSTSHKKKLRATVLLFCGQWLAFTSSLSFFFFFLIYFLAALGLRCCARAFSSCDERGGATLRCSARASHRSGFSPCRARALGAWASVVPRHVEFSRSRSRRRVPCLGRQILNHCATREVPLFFFSFIFLNLGYYVTFAYTFSII